MEFSVEFAVELPAGRIRNVRSEGEPDREKLTGRSRTVRTVRKTDSQELAGRTRTVRIERKTYIEELAGRTRTVRVKGKTHMRKLTSFRQDQDVPRDPLCHFPLFQQYEIAPRKKEEHTELAGDPQPQKYATPAHRKPPHLD